MTTPPASPASPRDVDCDVCAPDAHDGCIPSAGHHRCPAHRGRP